MSNKIEIFKLTIQAGSNQFQFNEEQMVFLIKCFQKAEKLSKGSSMRQFQNNNYCLKNKTGSSLFFKNKMAELKSNGQSYQSNRDQANEEWKNLSEEENI